MRVTSGVVTRKSPPPDLGSFAPDVVVVGAPKCGTTSLFELFERHPDVGHALFKEPHFFATDMPDHRVVNVAAKYRALFPNDGRQSAEGSVWYLYSADAAQNIVSLNPSAKFVVMLRRQDEMLPSLWRQFRYVFKEDTDSFDEAWDRRFERESLRGIPETCDIPGQLEYHNVASFGSQLERLMQTAPDGAVKVVFFDDIRRDSKAVVESVLDFVGLDHRGLDLNHVNERKEHRYPRLSAFMMHPRGPARVAKDGLRRIAPMAGKRIGRLVYRAGSGVADRPEVSPRVLSEIRETYAADNAHLADITGRDLSHWTDPV